MAAAQKPVPAVPASKQAAAGSEEFQALKKALNAESWEMSPNSWRDIQIIYTSSGSERQARSYLKAIELPSPEM